MMRGSADGPVGSELEKHGGTLREMCTEFRAPFTAIKRFHTVVANVT